MVALKAQIVTKGYGIGYEEMFSWVAKLDSIRTIFSWLLCWSCKSPTWKIWTPSGQSCSQLLHQFTKTYVEDMELLQFDVKMIFLHGDLEEEVYLATQGLWGTNKACRLVCRFIHNTKLRAEDDVHWANPSSLLVILGCFFLLSNKLCCSSSSSSGRIFSTSGSSSILYKLLAFLCLHWRTFIEYMRCGSHNFGRFTFHESANHPETAARRKSHWFKYNILYYTDQNAILHIHSIACILYKSILTVYTTTTHRTRAEEDSTRRATEDSDSSRRAIQILPGELKKIQILPEELKNNLPGELLRSATRSMEDSTRTAEVELEILFRGWAQQAGQRSEETTDVQILYSVAVTHFLTCAILLRLHLHKI